MIRRFARDESGITMAVTVFMVLLIGVMGAGLLTFVMSDLNSVIEVNKGQKAMDIAEAGVQAAKAHLRQDSFREHYDTDTDGANDCVSPSGIRVGKENWGRATYHWEPDPTPATSNPGECFTLVNNLANDTTTPWPENYGVTRTLGGGRFHVAIECFKQAPYAGTATTDPSCVGGAGDAPVPTIDPSDTKFYKITSTGYDTAAGDGAIRRIEAVYTTSKRTYAPIAYWSPRDILFSGTRCVSKMSFFSGRNIEGVTSGSGCGGSNPFGSGRMIAHRPPDAQGGGQFPPLPPADAIYGHWKNNYNPTMRTDASGNPITKTGFGALGLICVSSSCSTASNSVADGYNDYDSTTGTDSTRANNASLRKQYKFVGGITDPGTQITFPFEKNTAVVGNNPPYTYNPRELVDPGLLEEMRWTSDSQKSCYSAVGTCTRTTANPLNIDDTGTGVPWPGPGTVLFVDGADVVFKQATTPKPEGMIIVRDGNFSFSSSSSGFKGVIIVIGNGDLKADGTCDSVNSSTKKGYYKQAGSGQLDGYVAASGCMEINGNVSPSTTIDYTNLNTFYDIKLWSWQERYQVTW